VDGGDLAPAVGDRVVEGEPGDPLGGGAGDDLDALRGIGPDHVLDPGVEVLGVLADDDEVDVLVARLQPPDAARRPEIGVQPERLAEGHVDAPEALADRGRDRALERHSVTPDRLEDVLRQGRPVLGDAGLAGLDLLPLELHTGGVEDAPGCLRQLRSDAVAGDQRHSMGHGRILAGAAPAVGLSIDWSRPIRPREPAR
jgi:hypothetical protein